MNIDELVSIVIVTFNSAHQIVACLESLGPIYRQIAIVVDNHSADDTCEIIGRHFPEVRVIHCSENGGFGNGCNIGINSVDSRYVVILNPDVITSPQAIESLVEVMEQDESVGVIAPQLLNADGSRQSSCRTVQTPLTILLRRTPMGNLFFAESVLRRHLMLDLPDTEDANVDWVLGAFMLVRRSAISQIGGFDDRFFLYCEDMDWCLRMWRRGWRVVYHPAVTSLHEYQRTSRGIDFNRKATRLHFKSFFQFFSKYPGIIFGIRPHFLPKCTAVKKVSDKLTKVSAP